MNENTFFPKELKYLEDTDFLVTKHLITDKIRNLLVQSEFQIQKKITERGFTLPGEVLSLSGKISKGENYKLLPYLILDFPRYFKTENVFAYRTMFWWGNFFSCTLHLQGIYLEKVRKIISKNYKLFLGSKTFISVSKTPWEYEYTEKTYKIIDHFSERDFKLFIEDVPFIKLSRYIDIGQYDELPRFSAETLQLFGEILEVAAKRN